MDFLGLFAWAKLELVLIFGYIGYITIRVALGKATGLGVLFLPVSVIVIFGTMIVFTSHFAP